MIVAIPREHMVNMAPDIQAHMEMHFKYLPEKMKGVYISLLEAGAQIGFRYHEKISAPNPEECDATVAPSEKKKVAAKKK